MATHVKVLGVLHIVFSALGILAALAILAVFGGISGLIAASEHGADAEAAIPILGGIAVFIFCFLLAVSLPGLVAGIGLLQFRPWARILTIVLSAIELIHVPFGTALGIYGLWVLLSNQTEPLFRHSPSAAAY